MSEMLLSFLDDRLARGSESALMYIFDTGGGGRHRAIARDAPEGSGKLFSLLISREEPVFKRLLDYHGDILHRIRGLFNHC